MRQASTRGTLPATPSLQLPRRSQRVAICSYLITLRSLGAKEPQGAQPGHGLDSCAGRRGHQQTFTRFQKAFTGNELYGIQQFRDHLPGFQSLATAIPGYGTNDRLIPSYVLTWLDHHLSVVFGGDYLNQGKGRLLQIPGRFSPRLSYRMSLDPKDTLQVLHCRLFDFVRRVPIADERRCSRS